MMVYLSAVTLVRDESVRELLWRGTDVWCHRAGVCRELRTGLVLQRLRGGVEVWRQELRYASCGLCRYRCGRLEVVQCEVAEVRGLEVVVVMC